jgi:hypothetical protein
VVPTFKGMFVQNFELDSYSMTELVTSVSKSQHEATICFEGVSGFPNSNGEYVDSPAFTFDERSWVVRLYPAGATDSVGYCSCNLVKLSGAPCRAAAEFRIMMNGAAVSTRKVTAKNFNVLKAEWGVGHLLNAYNIEEQHNTYICDDNLTIKVSITAFGATELSSREGNGASSSPGALLSGLVRTAPTVPSYLASLFGQKGLTDVSIITADNRKIEAHRVVLAMRSDVFKSMLSSRMAERNTNQIVIDDCDPHTVRVFTEYLYTDRLPAHFTADTLSQLLGMARKYQVEPLERDCVAAIIRQLNVDNVLEVLELATLYDVHELRQAALLHLARRSDDVVFTNSFFTKLGAFWGNCAGAEVKVSNGGGTRVNGHVATPIKSVGSGGAAGKKHGKRVAEHVAEATVPAKKTRKGGKQVPAAETSQALVPAGVGRAVSTSKQNSSATLCETTTSASTNISGDAATTAAAPVTIPDEVCDVISALAGVITTRRLGNVIRERVGRGLTRRSEDTSAPRESAAPLCRCRICRESRGDYGPLDYDQDLNDEDSYGDDDEDVEDNEDYDSEGSSVYDDY